MKKIIRTEAAPAPIGPYNQAVLTGNMLFVSGQIAIIPESGELLDGSIEEETEQVMKNLGAILEEAGFGFDQVVKTTIFIKDMNDFALINGIYGKYFTDETAPARETVAVANLPKFVRVEISVIAVR